MKLFTLTSALHKELPAEAMSEPFIRDVARLFGEDFSFCTDFSQYISDDSLIYVRTGGTESIFKQAFFKEGTLEIPGKSPVRLLTSGKSNSLAAAMEILSFLNGHGRKGRIIHGTAEEIIMGLASDTGWSSANPVHEYTAGPVLTGKRYGVIGRPSDWLISSLVDYNAAKGTLGCDIVDIPIEELEDTCIQENGKNLASIRQLYPCIGRMNAINAPRYGKTLTDEDFRKAAVIYCSLKTLIDRHRLDGLTLRCFDLLDTFHTTGCLALAILNSEGITAACEGDVPAMLSMAVGKKLTGVAGFQANLSRAEGDRMLFAHCTLPLSTASRYCFDTHFESGIGIGIHGELPESRNGFIFKLGSDMRHCFCADVQFDRNQYEDGLCRTQIWVNAPGVKQYMLNTPLGNHHILWPCARPQDL